MKREGGGVFMSPECPSSGRAGAGARNFQGVEAPCPLSLKQKLTPYRETKTQKIPGSGSEHREGDGTQGLRSDLRRANPQGPTGTWVHSEVGKGGGEQMC